MTNGRDGEISFEKLHPYFFLKTPLYTPLCPPPKSPLSVVKIGGGGLGLSLGGLGGVFPLFLLLR